MNKKSRIKLIKDINKQALLKQADVAELLSSNFSSIIDKDHPYESILKIISTGVITRTFGLPWGIITVVLGTAGIDINSIFSKLKEVLSSFFATNPTITNDNVDSHATNLANQVLQHSSISQETLQTELQPAEASQLDFLKKYAAPIDSGMFSKLTSVLGLASKTGKFSFGGLLSGILFAVIKALFIGGGLTLAAEYVASKIRDKGKPAEQSSSSTTQTNTQDQSKPKETSLLQYIKSITHSSGKGEVIHKNDSDINNKGNYAWYVPSNGDLSKTLYNWIFEIYPEIPNNVEDVISENYSKVINPLLSIIQKWNSENINQLQEVRIPNNFITRKQIVDYILSSFILQ